MIFPTHNEEEELARLLAWLGRAHHKTESKSSTIFNNPTSYQNQYQDRNLPTMMLRNLAIAAALCVSSVEGFAFSPVSVSSQVEVDTLFLFEIYVTVLKIRII